MWSRTALLMATAASGLACDWRHDRANHKRVYRVMRDEGWLLYRHGEKPLDTRKHQGKVAVKESDVHYKVDTAKNSKIFENR